jgi:hypothetical protein
MESHTKQTDNNNQRFPWIIPGIIVLTSLFFSFAGLSEFYFVSIKGETGGYPWGPVNEVPWYYQSKTVYSIYNLISGILFFIIGLFTFWATMKKYKKLAVLGVGVTVLFILADSISSYIH